MFGEDESKSPRLSSPWLASSRRFSPASAASSVSTTASANPFHLSDTKLLGGGMHVTRHDCREQGVAAPVGVSAAPSRQVSAFQRRPDPDRVPVAASPTPHCVASPGSAQHGQSSLGKRADLRQELAARMLARSSPSGECDQVVSSSKDVAGATGGSEGPPTGLGCHEPATLFDRGFANEAEDDDEEEADGFFSLDMALDIDATNYPSAVTSKPITVPPTTVADRSGSYTAARTSPFSLGNSSSPLPSFRRDSKHSDAPSPAFGPIAPEIDRRGNLEYKLKILPPSRERFDRLVTQLKWRLLEGGGCAIYEIGVLDDGTLIGLDSASMKDSLKLLSAMAREVGACCEVRRVLALETAARQNEADKFQVSTDGSRGLGTAHSLRSSSSESSTASEYPSEASSRDGSSEVSVRALDDDEARLALLPATATNTQSAQSSSLTDPSCIEVGHYSIAISYEDDQDIESTPAGALLVDPKQSEPVDIVPVEEGSDEEGFGFSLSLDANSDEGTDTGLADIEAASQRSTISGQPQAGPDEAGPGQGSGAARSSDPVQGQTFAATLRPTSAGDTMPMPDLLIPNTAGGDSDPASVSDAANSDLAAIDIRGLQAYSLPELVLAAEVSRQGQTGGRRGREGRIPFADPELIVDPVTRDDFELLSERQAKINVGKMPKRRGKRRGASGWQIDREDDRDGTGASLERRMRRLAELKAAERAGAGIVADAEAGNETPDDLRMQKNSIAQELVQQMLALRLAHPTSGNTSASSGESGNGDSDSEPGRRFSARLRKQPPFKGFDEDAVSPFLTLEDADIENARDADGIRELFQRKRQEVLRQRQAYKQGIARANPAGQSSNGSVSEVEGITFLDGSSRSSALGDSSPSSISGGSLLAAELEAKRLAKMKVVADSAQPKTLRAQARARSAASAAPDAPAATASEDSGQLKVASPPSSQSQSVAAHLPSAPSLDTLAGYEMVMNDLGMVSERAALRASADADGKDRQTSSNGNAGGTRLIVEAVIRRTSGRGEAFTDCARFEGR